MITYSVITEFNISEVRQLFELSFACLLENNQVDFHPEDNQLLDEWFDIDEMFQYVKSEHAKYIEARDDDKLVGAVCMGEHSLLSWPDGKKTELFILAVDPSSRGQGIGRKLVMMAEAEAKKMGAQSMIVNTHQSLTAVAEFYKRLGYSEMGVLKNYYDNGNAVFFHKLFK